MKIIIKSFNKIVITGSTEADRALLEFWKLENVQIQKETNKNGDIAITFKPNFVKFKK